MKSLHFTQNVITLLSITSCIAKSYIQIAKTLFLSLLFLLPSTSFAQYDHIAFRHLTIDDGISSGSVGCIFKDSKEFMWFGTNEGLNRYDGHTITVFKNDPNSEKTISNNYITAIFEDSKNRIWIGTRAGLNLYEWETETFFTYQDTINDVYLKNIVVSNLGEDSNGIIWVTGYPGFFKFDTDNEEIINYRPDQNKPYSIAQDWTAGMYIGQNDKIWIGHDGFGLSEFNISDEKFVNYRFKDTTLDGTRIMEYNAVREVLPFDNGKFLLGAYGGLLTFDTKTKSFKRIIIDRHEFQATSALVLDQNQNRVWISTSGFGLYLWDLSSEHLLHWTSTQENLNGLSEKSLLSLFLDGQGLLWVGNSRKGIDILDTKNPFQNYQSSNSRLSSDLISCIFEESNGTILVGTSGGGLNILNNERQHDILHNSSFGKIFAGRYVTCIEEDNNQNIWIGTGGDGLYKYHLETGDYKRYTNDLHDTTSLNHNVINCIEIMQNGQLLIGTYLGYCLLDPKTEKFLRGAPGSTRAILAEKPGVAWFGFDLFGLFYLNLIDNIKMQFKHHEEDSLSISSSSVQSIFMDRDSLIWIGTNNGLNRYNREYKNFIRYSTHDGLCNNSIMGILEDNEGNLWLSTNRGISKYNKKTSTFNNYYVEDGLQSNQFSRGASYKSKNGLLYFGGVNGLTVFDPEKVEPRINLPKVAITEFYLFNQSVPLKSDPRGEYSYQLLLEKPIFLTKSINLKYYEKIFSLGFSALDYVNPDKNKYAFKLEGLEDQWNYTTSDKRFTTYTNLNPGIYSFMVKATNSDGIWNETPTIIEVRVDPPPWMTWWAYVIYGFTIISSIYLYHKSHQKRLAKKHQELEKEKSINERLNRVNKLKDEFLANTSHELRTPLTGIIGLTESLLDGVAGDVTQKMKSNLSLVISQAKRLSSLVNSILDFSRLKKHDIQLNLKNLDLRTTTEVVLKMSSPLCKGKPVVLSHDFQDNLPYVIADEQRLYQILFNLVGNSIKFTAKGSITVSANREGQMIQIAIKDTGIGIPKEKLADVFKSFEQIDSSITREVGGTGLGLAITKQLVELHGGTIWIESEISKGTCVYFSLPISDSEENTIVEGKPALSSFVESGAENSILQLKTDTEENKADNSLFTILIVDDEAINQQVLYNHLSNGKFRILQAMDGMQALNLLEKEKLDLVLLDIMMPKMSGYEVCKEIRKKYMPSELPIIMITAKDQVSDLVEGLTSGANDYLSKPFSKDELMARLKTHLNLYKINSAYLRFIPNEFIKALGHESILDVELGQHIQKEMTVLFADIRSFTSLTEKLTAEESFEFLNEFLNCITPAITSNEGFIDKYIGDAVMALFPYKAENALIAAIQAQQNLEQYNKIRADKGKPEIQIGIGIHTGPLMMGTIGVKTRMDGTVISDAVNLASRLEELNKHYGTTLIASENTTVKVEDLNKFHYRFLSNVSVKGKQKSNRIYEFFDGDEEYIKSMKIKTLSLFNEGIEEYYNRRFTTASVKFQEVLDSYPDDKTAMIFLQHSAKYMVEGVPADWDGVDIVDKVF